MGSLSFGAQTGVADHDYYHTGSVDAHAFLQTVMFSFAAIQALTAVLSACFGRIAPRLQSLACELWGCGTIDYVTLAACVPATLIVVVWFVGRHTTWAWPLQDAMGVALIMLLLRQFRLPDIKVAAHWLPLPRTALLSHFRHLDLTQLPSVHHCLVPVHCILATYLWLPVTMPCEGLINRPGAAS